MYIAKHPGAQGRWALSVDGKEWYCLLRQPEIADFSALRRLTEQLQRGGRSSPHACQWEELETAGYRRWQPRKQR